MLTYSHPVNVADPYSMLSITAYIYLYILYIWVSLKVANALSGPYEKNDDSVFDVEVVYPGLKDVLSS